MGRKGEQDVFPYAVCQVHHVTTFKWDMDGEIRHGERAAKLREAPHAFALDLRPHLAVRPEPVFADPDIEA